MLPVYVFTRFNIFIKYETGGRRIKGIDTCRDEDYLQKRFELFEKYTFKSMCGQSDNEFIWIVLFHDETPKRFKDRIKNYQQVLPQFKPYFLNDEKSVHFKELFHEIVMQNELDSVFTIRLDNDDAVTRDFISQMKQKSEIYNKDNKEFVLFFDEGYQYDLNNKMVAYYKDEKNHFCGLHSTRDKHILMYDHTKIENNVQAFHIGGTQNRIWMEIIHDSNVANETILGKTEYVKNETELCQFNFKIELNPSIRIKIKKFFQRLFRPFITVYRHGFINVFKSFFHIN